nr:nuclear GTPase SLIP-GC-like [Labrus bergylta]
MDLILNVCSSISNVPLTAKSCHVTFIDGLCNCKSLILFFFCQAKKLSAELVKYTRSRSKYGMAKSIKKWFWPLVKCVTIRVPNNDLLQNVTLVDLPGNGDRNKGRDKMWKGVIQSCSTVWIVTDINRAGSEKEPWEILKSASSLMGNGGQCQHIHFICTKSDVIEDSDDSSVAGVRAAIFKRNIRAKEEVKREFGKLKGVQTHFSGDCFKVFTVSSNEFLKEKRLGPDETEIPKLQEFLQELNDFHSVTLKYVSGAYGILSLIQGAGCGDVEEKIKAKLDKTIRERKKEIYSSLTTSIEENMQKCYEDAQQCKGKGSLNAMRVVIEQHVRAKVDMFKEAKTVMMLNLTELMVFVSTRAAAF